MKAYEKMKTLNITCAILHLMKSKQKSTLNPTETEIKKYLDSLREKEKSDIEEGAVISMNRKQYFVRIPRIVSDRLQLKKGDTLMFKIITVNGEERLEFEVKHAT